MYGYIEVTFACMYAWFFVGQSSIHTYYAVILTADSFLLGWGGVPYQVGQAGS